MFYENPPTAGLPVRWRDWLPTKTSLTTKISQQLSLPPLQLTCSGTAALIISLTTLKHRYPNKPWVIIPAYTCPLVALAIHHCGLKIRLCDLAINSFDFDFEQLPDLLDTEVLAVLPTHLGGQVADIERVKMLAKPYQITVVEDAAQALGADVGEYGDIVFFSLAAGKGLTMFEGGLFTSNDLALNNQLRQTQAQIIPKRPFFEIKRIAELVGYTALYNPFGLHFVYGQSRRRLINRAKLVEAVGDDFDFSIPLHDVSQLRQNVAVHAADRLPDFFEQTQKQAMHRIALLKQLPNINVVTSSVKNRKSVWPFIMIQLPSQKIRDNILNELWVSPFGVSRLFIHDLPHYEYLKTIIPQELMPNALNFAQTMLTITNSLWLTDEQFKIIFDTIEKQVK